jgi:hypothetical protein
MNVATGAAKTSEIPSVFRVQEEYGIFQVHPETVPLLVLAHLIRNEG